MDKKQIVDNKLGLIVFDSALELGNNIDKKLLDMYNLNTEEYTFLVPIKQNFFEDGHMKVEIKETIRGKDLFFLTDIGNYSLEYKMHGMINHTSPNDLMMQLKDGIGACNCHAQSINIVMPLLYAGRQHRRQTRENLMCGMNLHELDNISHIKSFITFDAHDQGVEHAVHNMEFDNFYATGIILSEFINNLSKEDLQNIEFIAPDTGATGRRTVYLNSFASPYITRGAGSFIKQRDYNNLIDGKYPIISHDYCGTQDLEGKTAIIIDDMISSGSSILDVILELKNRNVNKIYVIATYALFTRGIDMFDEYYNKGLLDAIYTTNLSYIPTEYKEKEWLHVCDCSDLVANVIYSIHNDMSISDILTDKSGPVKLLNRKFID